MPRRSRPIEYDDVVDGMEVYPRRAKGDRLLVDRDARYSRRVPRGHGPVVEKLDRHHVRERAKPEIPLGGYEYLRDDVLAAERLARLDLNAYRDEEVDKYKDMANDVRGSKSRGRRRERVSDVEEAYFSHADSTQDYTDSESDVVEEIVSKKKRPVMPRHDYRARKEAMPRSKSVKDERHMRRSEYDDGAFPKNSRSMEAFPGDKKGPRRDAAPRSHRRSHYHIDIVDDESDETDESELDVLPKHGRRGMAWPDPTRQKYSTRRRATPSSLSSSPESAGSSEEEELPKVPLPVPVPPIYKESPRRHKSLNHSPPLQIPRPPSPPTPPRVPDLETVLNEREARHRKRAEDAGKEEVGIEKRSRESLQLTSQEHNTRRKKGKPAAVVERSEVGSRDVLIEDEQVGPRVSYKKREIVEEDQYRDRDPQPSRSSPLSDAMDDWAIVQAPSKSKHSLEKELPAVDVREDPRRPRRKDRQFSPAEDEMIEPRHKGDTPRSKVGPRYIGVRDRRERLWTEITKDLVVKEAIERAGYEYEEMDTVYYIFSYLHPEDVNSLVEDSDGIRRARRRRIQQIQRERASVPPSSRRSPNKSTPILPERPPSPPVPPSPPPPPRQYRDERRDDRRRRERPREYEREEDIVEGRWRGRPGRW